MGSTRLPGKVMMKLGDRTVLDHVVTRVKLASQIHEVVVATTTEKTDHAIVEECQRIGVKSFRGSEHDVLSRYYYAAIEFGADLVVRVTSDCPLIDPFIIDAMVAKYQSGEFSIVSNASPDLTHRTFPRGLDAEIFSFQLLERAFHKATKSYQREHVTPYLYETCDSIYYYKNPTDLSKYRWTLDTQEDLMLIQRIYDFFYKGKHDFFLADVISLFERNPSLYDINKNVEQKPVQ